MARFAVKVIDAQGHEMYLRHGPRPGHGSIVSFTTRQRAEREAANIRDNLGDELQSVNVVPHPGRNDA